MSESEKKEELQEILDQSDIDRLLSSTFSAGQESEGESAEEPSVSLEDIEKLLEEGPEWPEEPEAETPLSQDEINRLLEGGDSREQVPEPAKSVEPEDGSFLSQDEINKLLENIPEDDVFEETPGQEEPESLAGDFDEDSYLLTQASLDELLSEWDESYGEEEDGLPLEEIETEEISQDDIDRLLSNVEEFKGVEEEESAVSREDIDILLGEGEEDEGLVTQDDIDLLLGQDDGDEGLVIGQDDIDQLLEQYDLDEEGEKTGETEALSQEVVLEEPDSPKEMSEEGARQKTGWYKSKLFIGCVSLVLIGIVSASLFFVLREENDSMPLPSSEAPSVSSGDDTFVAVAEKGKAALNGFLVLAPESREDMAYLRADIFLDLENIAVQKEIKNNEPFYRDLIYGVITKVMVNQEETEMVEEMLPKKIKDALNGALPQGVVEKVTLTRFSAT